MKSVWSRTWKSSVQPRKQRKHTYNAPQHERANMMACHLNKSLRKKYSTRSLTLRKDDEVKILRGKRKGAKGKVSRVDLGSMRVFVDGQTRDNTKSGKVSIPFHPSNLMITSIGAIDKMRFKRSKVKPEPKKEEKKPTAKKEEEKKPTAKKEEKK